MKITFDKFKRMLLESSSSIYDEYEDILCEVFDVDSISEIKEKDYDEIMNQYKGGDLNDNDSALLEDAEELVIRAAIENGYNLVAHHGTVNRFTEFKYGDIGFHFGTVEQARSRLKVHNWNAYYDEENILNLAISIHNPLVCEFDIVNWNPLSILNHATKAIYNAAKPFLSSEQKAWSNFPIVVFDEIGDEKLYKSIEKRLSTMRLPSNSDTSSLWFMQDKLGYSIKEIIDMLLSRPDENAFKNKLVKRIRSMGYDGIKYLNKYEGRPKGKNNWSYIVFDPNKIKNCEVISFKDGKIVPLENRFNRKTNNLFETNG